MQRCRRCVIPDTRPDTHFEDGLCSACRAYDQRKAIDWDARMADLIELLKAHHRPNDPFDCVIPSSGGKDSTWQTVQILKLGYRPLVVTATTCHLTPIGRHNIDNLSRWATTIEVSPNKIARAKLNVLGMELVGDISWPEHVSIFTIPFKIAARMRIPLIFYGENPQNQYGGPPGTEEERQMTRRWVQEFGGFLGLRPHDLEGINGLKRSDLQDYMPEESDFTPEAYFLGQFLEWDSHRNANVAIAHGMAVLQRADPPCQASLWAVENLDNAQTGIHDHMMYRKYGYGRLAAQASVEIRKGKMTREHAMELVRERDGLFPESYAGVHMSQILTRLGKNTKWLMANLERYTTQDLFATEVNRRPILKEFA